MNDNWKSPGTIFGIVAAIVSIGGLYLNSISIKNEVRKVNVEIEKLNNFKEEQEKRDSDKKQKLTQLTKNINDQISEVDEDIKNCKEKLGTATLGLETANSKQDLLYYMTMYQSYTHSWMECQHKKDSLIGVFNTYLLSATK